MASSRNTFKPQGVVAIAAMLLLAGCQTAAQREFQSMSAGIIAVSAQAKSCTEEVLNPPEAALLRPHSPFDPREATIAQLSDQSLANQQEIDAILALHDRRGAA